MTEENDARVRALPNVKENGPYVGLLDAGQGWHTDVSYRDVRGFVNVRYEIRIPRCNSKLLGGTEFSNMRISYDALPESVGPRLTDGTVTRGFEKFWEYMRRNKAITRPPMREEQRRRRPPVVHPLFLAYPFTVRRVLHRNLGHATRVNLSTIQHAIADYASEKIPLMRRCQVMTVKIFDPAFLLSMYATSSPGGSC